MPAEDFQKLAGYAYVRNVLLMGERGRLHIVWPNGIRGGAKVVMDQLAESFLSRRVPDKLLFRPETEEGKKLVGKARLVTHEATREYLKLSHQQMLGVLKQLRQYKSVEGRQLFYADSVEKYKAKKGRR